MNHKEMSDFAECPYCEEPLDFCECDTTDPFDDTEED